MQKYFKSVADFVEKLGKPKVQSTLKLYVIETNWFFSAEKDDQQNWVEVPNKDPVGSEHVKRGPIMQNVCSHLQVYECLSPFA